jgi:hypothetical protein
MDPSRAVSPSHLFLHRLAELRQVEANEKPQLVYNKNSSEIKVNDTSKTYLQSWISSEDWQNFVTWQQNGLLAIPTLLSRSIQDLTDEVKNSTETESELIQETLIELKLATQGLSRMEEFPHLSEVEKKIVHEAIREIAYFSFKLENRMNNSELIPLNETYVPPSGLTYYLPTALTSLKETPEQTRKREASTICLKLSEYLEENITPSELESLQFLLNQSGTDRLKTNLTQTLYKKAFPVNSQFAVGEIFQLTNLNSISNERLKTIKLDVLSLLSKLSTKLGDKDMTLMVNLLQKLATFVDPAFTISKDMMDETFYRMREGSSYNQLSSFLTKLEHILKTTIITKFNSKDYLDDITADIQTTFAKSWELHMSLPQEVAVKQYVADVTRGNTILRTDEYLGVHDIRGIPEPVMAGKVDEELAKAKALMLEEGLNAIKEICKPDNPQNLYFIPLIQLAACQTTLNALFSAPIGEIFEDSVSFEWIDNGSTTYWRPLFGEGDLPPVMVSVIRDSDNNIEKIHIDSKGSLNIEHGGIDSKKSIVVVNQAVVANLSYNVSAGINGKPVVTDVICEYKTGI